MATFKKYLPLVITFLGAVSPLLSPVVQGFWEHHPAVVAGIAGAWATFKWALPSPLQK